MGKNNTSYYYTLLYNQGGIARGQHFHFYNRKLRAKRIK